MITTLKITRIIIDHIDKIETEEVKEFPELGESQKTLTIWTKEGEKYELIFEAAARENLEFQTPAIDDWLSPKLYHGRVDDD